MRLPSPLLAGLTLVVGCAALATALPAQAVDVPGEAYEVVSQSTDPDGTTHTRMRRTLGGLEVVGGDVVVHRDARGRSVGRRSASLPGVVALPTTRPAVSPESARRSVSPGAGRPTLLVDALNGTPRLAWRTYTGGRQADGIPSRLATYVDARTGRVIRTEEEIVSAGVGGWGTGYYAKRVPLYLFQNPSTRAYLLRDPRRGQIRTHDMRNREDSYECEAYGAGCWAGAPVSSKDRYFGTGRLTSRETVAVDAQYATQKTWDYFKGVHGLAGVDGTNIGTFNRVHYGTRLVNAFWDGASASFGDGNGTSWGPMVTLDIVSHELAHGVTQYSANLAYSGEPGGLNESTSDIFGAMVEFAAGNANDNGDYLLGEKADRRYHRGLRRMDNPKSDGRSQNCWTTRTRTLDPHFSSGVGNHFFYLLAEGTGTKRFAGVTHSSTACNGGVLRGIGRTKAAAIWFRGLTEYMTSGTTYRGARLATLRAATDLYGADSPEYAAVDAAWVGVNVRG